MTIERATGQRLGTVSTATSIDVEWLRERAGGGGGGGYKRLGLRRRLHDE